MKNKTILLVQKYLLCGFLATALMSMPTSCAYASTDEVTTETKVQDNQHIKIALLLDTSNSMDGLIEQTKSQLWTIVNELSTAKCDDDQQPDLEIALYEYGNDWLSASNGHIRQVCSLTNDLDLISEKLFALKTNGGNEFCGQVIKASLDELEWGTNENDLKIIFIAGNEPFTQGSFSYQESCKRAVEKGIAVNTIFCGDFQTGINSGWKNGADLTHGTFMSIEQNQKTVFIESPYDHKIDSLNTVLNNTYIPYGNYGKSKKESQIREDKNAESYSSANKVKRTVTKSSTYYKNDSWDLVDATSEKSESFVTALDNRLLPQEMQEMSDTEKNNYVKEKAEQRVLVQKEIQSLNTKRSQHIKNQPIAGNQEGMLDQAMIKSIKIKAKEKGLTF